MLKSAAVAARNTPCAGQQMDFSIYSSNNMAVTFLLGEIGSFVDFATQLGGWLIGM